MRRNIILTIALLVLAGVVYYMFKTGAGDGSTKIRAESNFKIEDIESIGRIVLTQPDGVTCDLTRGKDHWMVNGTHKVRQTSIDFLLKGLELQHLDHIPGPEASQTIMSSIDNIGIRVEVFGRNAQLLLDFRVGAVTNDERGTYFVKAGSSQPYCLTQPGFEGGLRARYALTPLDWRDVRFWMEDLEKADSIIVDYPNQKQYAFMVVAKGAKYEVTPVYNTTPLRKGDVQARVRSYFTSLTQLACEDYVNEAHEKDSILRMTPFMEMKIIYPESSSRLRFYPIGQLAVSEFSPVANRYFIDYQNRDFMVGQYNVIKGAFRSYQYFYGE
jgi:hypothetical protein